MVSVAAGNKKPPCSKARRLIAFGWLPGLLIVQHGPRGGFAQFELCTHFLKARGQGLNFCRLSFSCGLQFLHNALLFEQLVRRERRGRTTFAELVSSLNADRNTSDRYTRDVADIAGVGYICTSNVSADT